MREVALAGLGWPAVLGIVYGADMGRDARGRSRGAAGRYIYDQCFVYRLAAGEVCIESAAHWFFRAEEAILPLFPGANAQSEVGRIEMPAQRVGIFSQDHVAHVVDQIVFVNGDERGRSAGAPDPNLSGHHVSVDGNE